MSYKPVISLVGRTNVGKSTLFNRLTKTRNAIVADFPGLTRDRHYGEANIAFHKFIVIDTGGLEPNSKDVFSAKIASQTNQAILESDVIIFLLDARSGICNQDYEIAKMLRKIANKRIFMAINKSEGMSLEKFDSDFYKMGLGKPYLISSSHGDGIYNLFESALSDFPTENDLDIDPPSNNNIRLAIVGKPNVGKSTLINSIIGEERLIAFDMPGTTKDSIDVDFSIKDRNYVLVDTAGIRKKSKVFDYVEKFSVVKTLQSIESSNVVLLVLDACSDISEQDAHIAGFILESGKAIVIAINKCDSVKPEEMKNIERTFQRKMHFLSFARMHMISAIKKYNIRSLFDSINEAYESTFANLSTPKINRLLKLAVEKQPPPKKNILRPKMRYAHQGGQNPPVIVIHGNSLDLIPKSYVRFLESFFRKEFSLTGTPLRIDFKSSNNPYV
ncbi:GTP-binding protein [Candidatus Kinetoplastibacterium desouzaii TCC079E]|uniref:GTPase Der n=1 Tax=Candidatus Kinetoplastidibacterium desouzai TCC079E TaxID=1208919 RepID=M1LS21_9PROT|nr:ribosome biogenesis GTPase Der [Candidatus Kinetoplastibacterium desouzaii]AGF46941.1 GTP-binding protein [Candidatus Kinetoplastibacterium desouzaii TCC079E]